MPSLPGPTKVTRGTENPGTYCRVYWPRGKERDYTKKTLGVRKQEEISR